MGPRHKEELELEYKHKVTTVPKYSLFGSSDTKERSLQGWVEALLKTALAQDRRKRVRKRRRMEQEDAHSRSREAWEKIWEQRTSSPFFSSTTAMIVDWIVAMTTIAINGNADDEMLTHLKQS